MYLDVELPWFTFPAAHSVLCQEMQGSIVGEAADNLADLWATRADILMNLGGLKRASTVPHLIITMSTA